MIPASVLGSAGKSLLKGIYYKMKEELYMSDKMKKGIRKAAFIVGGMVLGLAYYYFVGCKTGG